MAKILEVSGTSAQEVQRVEGERDGLVFGTVAAVGV